MPAEGYTRGGKPDVGWWRDQLEAGAEFRKKMANEARWPDWRKYYRGQWAENQMPVNLFFSMLRAMVPRVYFRNPAVSVSPDLPGPLFAAFAHILNRIDNKLVASMNMKYEMKDMVHDTFITGTAIGKLGFGGLYTPSIVDGTEIPEGPTQGERLDYMSGLAPKMPWFTRLDPGCFIVPDETRRLHEARWAAHVVRRPKEDVARDPRFPKGLREDLPATLLQTTSHSGFMREVAQEMVELVEVRDRKFDRVFILVPNGRRDGAVLYDEVDPQSTRRLPFFEICFNPDDEAFWGVPDAQILEPAQLEINETRTLIMKHRRQSILKILYERGAITSENLARLQSEDVLAGVEIVDNINRVQTVQAADIPQAMFLSLQTCYQDAREAIGFSRNQLGDFQSRRGDTSATEAQHVAEGSEIRVDEKRDGLADLLSGVIQETNEIIFDLWNEEQLIDVVGPGGVPLWVRVNPSQLRNGKYAIKVDPDSSVSRTRQQREAKAIGLYNLLKTNPLIDPIRLTQYLLREMEGVDVEDLMRALPPLQMNPGVVNPAQLSQIMTQQVGAAQNGQGNPLLGAGF